MCFPQRCIVKPVTNMITRCITGSEVIGVCGIYGERAALQRVRAHLLPFHLKYIHCLVEHFSYQHNYNNYYTTGICFMNNYNNNYIIDTWLRSEHLYKWLFKMKTVTNSLK